MLPLANKIMIRLSTLVNRQLVIKMKDYIATFYTVYDAMVFQRILERRMSIPTKLNFSPFKNSVLPAAHALVLVVKMSSWRQFLSNR